MLFDRQPKSNPPDMPDGVPNYSGSTEHNQNSDSPSKRDIGVGPQETYVKNGRPALIEELVRRGKTVEEAEYILGKSLDI